MPKINHSKRAIADRVHEDIGASMTLIERMDLDEYSGEISAIAALARKLRAELEAAYSSVAGSTNSS